VLQGCFSLVENGLGKVDGGSGGVSAKSVALDVVTLPGQIVLFTGLFLDYEFERFFTEKGRRKYAYFHGAKAGFDVLVVDESGKAVPNAVVRASFTVDRARPSLSSATTDDLGRCYVSGVTSERVRFEVAHERFYPAQNDFCFIHRGKDAHKVSWGWWQPRKIPVAIVMKSKVKGDSNDERRE